MKEELIDQVTRRAGGLCEYCNFPSEFAWLPFQIDHVIAQKHGGPTDLSNLALSCFYCNSFKGPSIAGIDPQGEPDVAIQLFHPRKDIWREHFNWSGPILTGKTEIGRVTIAVLRMNDSEAIEVRRLILGRD